MRYEHIRLDPSQLDKEIAVQYPRAGFSASDNDVL